MLENKP